ncbi:flagellar export chaperone FliS [Pseudolysinimonas sp.]
MTYPSTNDYLRETVLSATPAQLVTMLYDRLLLDLARAEAAQSEENWVAAGAHLLHAQDIITELANSLDVDAWAGGRDLLALYTYLGSRLIAANVQRDVRITRECSEHLGPLRWAWLAAAEGLASSGTPTAEQGIAVVA